MFLITAFLICLTWPTSNNVTLLIKKHDRCNFDVDQGENIIKNVLQCCLNDNQFFFCKEQFVCLICLYETMFLLQLIVEANCLFGHSQYASSVGFDMGYLDVNIKIRNSFISKRLIRGRQRLQPTRSLIYGQSLI